MKDYTANCTCARAGNVPSSPVVQPQPACLIWGALRVLPAARLYLRFLCARMRRNHGPCPARPVVCARACARVRSGSGSGVRPTEQHDSWGANRALVSEYCIVDARAASPSCARVCATSTSTAAYTVAYTGCVARVRVDRISASVSRSTTASVQRVRPVCTICRCVRAAVDI